MHSNRVRAAWGAGALGAAAIVFNVFTAERPVAKAQVQHYAPWQCMNIKQINFGSATYGPLESEACKNLPVVKIAQDITPGR